MRTGFAHPTGPDTVVSWELEGAGGKTHLPFVHSGFGPDRAGAGYQIGWAAFVASLKPMIEIGDSWRCVEQLQPASA